MKALLSLLILCALFLASPQPLIGENMTQKDAQARAYVSAADRLPPGLSTIGSEFGPLASGWMEAAFPGIPGIGWLLKEPWFVKIYMYFKMFRDLVREANLYWQKLMGVAGMISEPGKFLKIVSINWLDSCIPNSPLPGFLSRFLDIISGQQRIIGCDPGLAEYVLENLAGGTVYAFDRGGNIVESPTNNEYSLQRYEAVRYLSSLGAHRQWLKQAAIKGSMVQYRVYAENYNAARGLLDALSATVKVQAIRTDINSTNVMLKAIKRADSVRAQGSFETLNSAAIHGMFNAPPIEGEFESSSATSALSSIGSN